ncbi:MAG: hypothetical protein K0R08_432 [Solimicrobium sp.]|nr:hypothetical protein [Solimicrobium sp.]
MIKIKFSWIGKKFRRFLEVSIGLKFKLIQFKPHPLSHICILRYKLLSINVTNCPLASAPTFCAAATPFLNRISVGMPRTPN